MVKMFSAFLFALSIFASSIAIAQPQKIEEVGRVIQLKGEVVRKPIEAYQECALKLGDPVWMFDTLTTQPASATKVLLIDGSTIALSEKSSVQITRYVYDPKSNRLQSLFDLVHGKVLARLSNSLKRHRSNFFEIETGNSVAGVRGSEFFVERKGSDTVIGSIESPTYVQSRNGKIAAIAPRQLIRVKEGQGPGPVQTNVEMAALTEGFSFSGPVWQPEAGFKRLPAREIDLKGNKIPDPWIRKWRAYDFSDEPLWFPKINAIPQEQRRKQSKIPTDGKITVAVVEFAASEMYGGEAFAQEVTESLISALAERKDFRVLDRSRMREILAEKKLSEFGLVDDPKAAGYFLGAEYLMAGSITRLGNHFAVSGRLIDCHSTEIVAAHTLEFKDMKKMNKVVKSLAAELAEKAGVLQGEKPDVTFLKVDFKSVEQTLDQVFKGLRRDTEYFEADIIEVNAQKNTATLSMDRRFSGVMIETGVWVKFLDEAIDAQHEMPKGVVISVGEADFVVRYKKIELSKKPEIGMRVALDGAAKPKLYLSGVEDVTEKDDGFIKAIESRWAEKLLESEVFEYVKEKTEADIMVDLRFSGSEGERVLRVVSRDPVTGVIYKTINIEQTGL